MAKFNLKTDTECDRLRCPPKPPKQKHVAGKGGGVSMISFVDNSEYLSMNRLYNAETGVSYKEQCYTEIRKIGEGSFGVVFSVEDKNDGKPYALKMIKSKVFCKTDFLKCCKEIRNNQMLPTDEHIVRMYSAWMEDNQVFLLLEWCKHTLDIYGKSRFPLPNEELWYILHQTAQGLKHLHDMELVHADIKLENIFQGADNLWKIGDFGLVQDISQGILTELEEGDARTLAPEILSKRMFTKEADIFSLGISFLEVSTNIELPSNGETWQELRSGSFPDKETKHVETHFLNVLKAMMHPDPSLRPTSTTVVKICQIRSFMDNRTPPSNTEQIQIQQSNDRCAAVEVSMPRKLAVNEMPCGSPYWGPPKKRRCLSSRNLLLEF